MPISSPPRPRRRRARRSRRPRAGRGRSTSAWREELVKAQALAEAGLDFADEADVAADAAVQADASVAKLLAAMSTHLADRRGERLRDGFRVVIAGPPNAGKSSLLNALARRDVAIVSEEAGTTRDVIEVHLDLSGLPVIVTDTAGIRAAQGAVEAEGIRRTLARVEDADLVLWMVDAAGRPQFGDGQGRLLSAYCRQITVFELVGSRQCRPLRASGRLGSRPRPAKGVSRLVDVLRSTPRRGLRWASLR